MKLSTRSRYGLRLMLALALNNNRKPVFLKDIARAEEISEKYLSQIIIPLKARGLVNTFRGAHGGYVLSRPPSQIKLLDILESLEGDICLVDCVKRPDMCGRSTKCVTREIWDEMSVLLSGFLEKFSLEDITEKYKNKTRLNQYNGDYYI